MMMIIGIGTGLWHVGAERLGPVVLRGCLDWKYDRDLLRFKAAERFLLRFLTAITTMRCWYRRAKDEGNA